MSSLTLRLRDAVAESPRVPRLDLSGVTPDRVLELPLAEIEQLPISCEQAPMRLGDFFQIRDEGRQRLVLAGDLQQCDRVAGGMATGSLVVESSVGRRLADNMRGGQLTVQGSAGDFACSNLFGGTVLVAGDVSDHAAGVDLAPTGTSGGGMATGMRGGRLVVQGRAGRWLAHRMRRGTVVVHGDCDAAAATRMIAGSIVLCGHVTQPMCAGMQRGTMLLLGKAATAFRSSGDQAKYANFLPGFPIAEKAEMSWLPLLLRDLQPYLPLADCPSTDVRIAMRCTGDRSVAGQGELLWLVESVPSASAFDPL